MNNIQSEVSNILLPNSTGIGATSSLADTWYYLDEINISTPFGPFEVSENVQRAKFIHLLSNECSKATNEKAQGLLASLSEGYLGAFHKKAMLKGESPIASDDTMPAEEYKERNIALIDKELNKVRNNINSLSESGYITKIEADKALKKASKDVESIFNERYGEIYNAKVEKEKEFAEIKDMFESVGLNKLIFKKTETALSVIGECSLLDLQAINARASVDSFTLKNHKMNIAAGIVSCTFEKDIK